MPRISRNVVAFTVGKVQYQARFGHQHATTDRNNLMPLNLDELGIAGDWDEKVLVPIVEGSIKLRHVTTCTLYRLDKQADVDKGQQYWVEVGRGQSRCSVKDRYDWRKGIKASFTDAIISYGVTDDAVVRPGQFLNAFYTELRRRPNVDLERVG
jgi:hypothetical protein